MFPYIRRLYVAKYAQKKYEETLSESRSGIPLNKDSFYQTEKIISDAVRKGQHIYHDIKANDLPVSTSTVYRHIKNQYYSKGLIDLPRAVKFKPRHTSKCERIPAQVKQGRTCDDFLYFLEQNENIPLVQLDTIIGRIGGKTIMTIHFVNSDFMIGLLLDNKTATEAAHKIETFKQHLSDNGFTLGELIPLLLTDNGGEFSIVSAFENNSADLIETHMFFCEPRSPYEKPDIEKNHTLFRDIVPKGTSFDDFTQDTVNLIFSHVNAVKRKQFNGKSAYGMFTFAYSAEPAEILGISYIPPTEVIQAPLLLKQV